MSKMGDFFKKRLRKSKIPPDVLQRPVRLTICYDGGHSILEIVCPWGAVRELVFNAEERIADVLRDHLGSFECTVLEVVPQ